jgi:hypothetical protein
MLKSINIVWASGSEGYHLERALRDYPEPQVLAALADQLLQAGMAEKYTDAMRRSVEIVDYHRNVQNGATVCKAAHAQLKRQPAVSWVLA